MKKGILGGTFDPIHNGHLYLAENAYREFGLDLVFLMPANVPYFKTVTGHVTDASLRLEMTKLAAGEKPFLRVSDFELMREGNTYTAVTLESLKALHPEDELYFIMGADSLYKIEKWYKPEIIFSNAVILCAGRSDEAAEISLDEKITQLKEKFSESKPDIRKMSCGNIDISSTMIREMISKGEDISSMVPRSVEKYILKKGLYR